MKFSEIERPFISIIVVTWNARSLLKKCLISLYNQTYKRYEVIVVDNASEDKTAQMIKEEFPNVKLIILKENKGFTGGNIEGLKHAKGEFIALLNNDAEASPQWLETLIKPMLEDPQVGICTSKVVIKNTNILDSAGGGLTTAFSGFKIGMGERADIYNKKRYVPGGYACACLYRKKMLDEIGFFDEDFVFNHEDTDLDFRALLAGWRCVYVPDATVEHKVSATLGHMSAKSVYYFSRNSEFVWIKNAPTKLMLKYLHHRILYEIASFGYFGIMHRQWKAFLKGKWDAIKFLPKMMKKRKEIQTKNKKQNFLIEVQFMAFPKYIIQRIKSNIQLKFLQK